MRLPVILIACLIATPALAGNTSAIKTISQTIDYARADTLADQISGFHGKFDADDRMIYLDLVIQPEDSEDKARFQVNGTNRNGVYQAVACDGFARLKTSYASYDFAFNPGYNHLLLTLKGDPVASHPFMTVACEYNSAVPGQWQLRFSGYFAVSKISIPTADDIELRPVTPAISNPVD